MHGIFTDYPHSKLDDFLCNDAINPQIPDQIQPHKINTSNPPQQLTLSQADKDDI